MTLDVHKLELALARAAMTKGQLADKAGISRRMFASILRRRNCSPINAGRIATGLGVDVAEIAKEK